MDTQQGYTEATQFLHKHFGNEMIIANAYLEKALNWTSIKPDDCKSCNAMQNLDYLCYVASNLKLLISKLPFKLRERWRTRVYQSSQRNACSIQASCGLLGNTIQYPFVLGDIRDLLPIKGPIAKTKNIDSRTPRGDSSFVTTVTPAEQQATREQTIRQRHAIM